jgi:hypothetical protein
MGITRRSATAREIKVRLRKLTARVPQRLRLWFAGLHEPSRYRIQPGVYCPALGALFFARHHDIRYLKRWRLTRQRKHFVHSDPGSDRCIAQARFANRFLHATGAQLRNVREDPDDALFSGAYLRGFATLHCPDGFSRNVAELTIWFAETPSLNKRTICL